MFKCRKILIILTVVFFMFISCSNKNDENKINFESKPLQIKGSAGNLSVILQTPELQENEKCPIVILMHGITSEKQTPLMVMLADKLQSEGIASVRFDFNGHGESDGEFVDMTVPKEIEDAKTVYEYAKNLNFVESVSLLGHSQGGVVASMLAGELKDNIKSVTLMAAAAVLEDEAKNGNTLGINFNPNDAPEYIEFNDYRIGRDYIKTAQNLNIYQVSSPYEGAVCIIHGTEDEIVPFSYGERYDSVYKNSVLYPIEGENHSFGKDMNLATDIAVDFIKNMTKN